MYFSVNHRILLFKSLFDTNVTFSKFVVTSSRTSSDSASLLTSFFSSIAAAISPILSLTNSVAASEDSPAISGGCSMFSVFGIHDTIGSNMVARLKLSEEPEFLTPVMLWIFSGGKTAFKATYINIYMY